MNFYKHHIGDYAQATAHLSFVEDAAYSRMIRKYYAEERPLPADVKAVQRLVGARTREEKQAVSDVLEEFFELREDGWHNKRCDSELAENQSLDEDREARAANERERQRRHREERRKLFEQLRALDIVPAWDTRTETLRKLFQDTSATASVTQPATLFETQQSRPVTPPVTRTATANQTPDSRLQTPIKEKEKEKKRAPAAHVRPPDIPEQVWSDWLALRKAKRAPVTQTVIDGARAEAEKAGLALADFLAIWCRRGSQGLEASWLKPEEIRRSSGRTASEPAWRTEQRNRVLKAVPGIAARPDAATTIDVEVRHVPPPILG